MSFLQALINGIALAAVYSLLGMGFVIIYKSMQVLSFAQPALMLFGGWWVVYFATLRNMNFYLAVLIAIVIAAISGLFIERVFLRPMVGKPVFAVAIMTIGLDLAVTGQHQALIADEQGNAVGALLRLRTEPAALAALLAAAREDGGCAGNRGADHRARPELEGGEILTAWLREVRRLCNERAQEVGHPIKLGCRVPFPTWSLTRGW